MYKRALTVLLTAHLLFLAGFLCLGQMEEIQRNLQIKVPVAADSENDRNCFPDILGTAGSRLQ